MADQDLETLLSRIAAALERLAPPEPAKAKLDKADAFAWHADANGSNPSRT